MLRIHNEGDPSKDQPFQTEQEIQDPRRLDPVSDKTIWETGLLTGASWREMRDGFLTITIGGRERRFYVDQKGIVHSLEPNSKPSMSVEDAKATIPMRADMSAPHKGLLQRFAERIRRLVV